MASCTLTNSMANWSAGGKVKLVPADLKTVLAPIRATNLGHLGEVVPMMMARARAMTIVFKGRSRLMIRFGQMRFPRVTSSGDGRAKETNDDEGYQLFGWLKFPRPD